MQTQLTLFGDPEVPAVDLKISRSGTFVDNMSLPVHRWFRYSAGFAAQWVNQVLDQWKIDSGSIVLDPFAGSGTVSVACDTRRTRSISVEAHPIVSRICKAKLAWATSIERFNTFAEKIRKLAKPSRTIPLQYPSLIQRSYDADSLTLLDSLKTVWLSLNDQSPESELVWLAITAILRPCSKAGTAQWQYILPNKSKAKVVFPDTAFRRQIEMMKLDMRWMQKRAGGSLAEVLPTDARCCSNFITQKIDAVITSPPYANNYDYADALRFEMTFWGDVNGWGDIHEKVRKYLIVSSSQHSSRDKIDLESLVSLSVVEPIREELTAVVHELSRVRENHGGKKHYHTMVAAYCRDISIVLHQLRRVCKKDTKMCWVIGDSAPYGVYCPIERWIGELALAAGFKSFTFEKLRDRNIKWKNRKHRVPLKEGLLWIEG